MATYSIFPICGTWLEKLSYDGEANHEKFQVDAVSDNYIGWRVSTADTIYAL